MVERKVIFVISEITFYLYICFFLQYYLYLSVSTSHVYIPIGLRSLFPDRINLDVTPNRINI